MDGAVKRLHATALLLDVQDLHDGDRIVAFLTAEHGLKRGVARGARRKYSRYAGQLQPLARVGLTWFEKPGRDLVRIEDVAMERAPAALHHDLERILVGTYLAEHIAAFAQENQPAPHMLRLLESAVVALEAGIDPGLVARYVEVWVLRLGGIFPPPRQCPVCLGDFDGRGAVLPEGGDSLVCPDCARGQGGERIDVSVLHALLQVSRQSLSEISTTPPDACTLRALESLSASVRRYFLQHELRSYRVMQRTLAEVGR